MSCTTEDGGHAIAGCGELNVETCLEGLCGEEAQCEFTGSDPVRSYREAVADVSDQFCLAESPSHVRWEAPVQGLRGRPSGIACLERQLLGFAAHRH